MLVLKLCCSVAEIVLENSRTQSVLVLKLCCSVAEIGSEVGILIPVD